MEIVMLLGIACCVAACVGVLMPASRTRMPWPLVVERVRLALVRWLTRWLERLGASAVTARLLERGCWRRSAQRVALMLRSASIRLSAGACCAAIPAGAVAAAIAAALLMGSAVCAPVVFIALMAGVPAWDAYANSLERKKTAAQMPQVFRTLSVAMGSGQTLAQAVEYVGAHTQGQVGESFLGWRCASSAARGPRRPWPALTRSWMPPGWG